jgi:hypothetical protein
MFQALANATQDFPSPEKNFPTRVIPRPNVSIFENWIAPRRPCFKPNPKAEIPSPNPFVTFPTALNALVSCCVIPRLIFTNP